VVGVSHRTAGVEVRERFALAAVDLRNLLQQQALAGRPALLLSTCNRAEFYWSGTGDCQEWFTDFARARGVTDTSAVLRWDGEAAVHHLFSVAAGLDSQVLGESEILGQVRRAYDIARAAGTTTWEMDAVFSAALAAGRRVRHETKLGRHPASVSSAAVDVVAERLGALEACNILVLGAGEAAEGVLRALHERRAARVMLVNRRPERARALAEAWGATVGGWDELSCWLGGADVVFVATGAKYPILSATQLRVAREARRALGGCSEQPLVVVDLSVPRNVEPAARDLPQIALVDLDDLQRLRCPVTGDTIPALAEAERVLEDELARLAARIRGRVVGPQLADLHRFGQELAERETAWALAQLDGLSHDEQRVVREMADRLVRRVLYPVSRAVRATDL
jgi:glutamyl-tRNA reductase